MFYMILNASECYAFGNGPHEHYIHGYDHFCEHANISKHAVRIA